jgi:hypothetical protein
VAVPTQQLEAIRKYCEARVPKRKREQVRVEYAARGNRVTISELRPMWSGVSDEWIAHFVAQLRYDPADNTWTICWRDRTGWRPLPALEPGELASVLEELTADPSGLFWGAQTRN